MSYSDTVRYTRDGDQFHYYWAARQCLRLLPADAALVAVSIEGASAQESDGQKVEVGEEVIDVGLYFGHQAMAQATSVEYFQLKHSTKNSHEPWTVSGLKDTITGFSKRYAKFCDAHPPELIKQKVRFAFLTNRPVAPEVMRAIDDLAADRTSSQAETAEYLKRYASESKDVPGFFSLFRVHADEPGLWDQRNLLTLDSNVFLSEPDADAAGQLKELVQRRATSAGKDNPTILRHDVLSAFKVNETQLFPAPYEGTAAANEFPREQHDELVRVVRDARSALILHADGGVGKSVVARQIARSFTSPSTSVVYDCFGDGSYRRSDKQRHRHVDALVQIVNELAAKGLCLPVIPVRHTDVKLLMQAFVARIDQAARLLRATDANAVLCIIIDAADNAVIAARERNELAFVRDLIRIDVPEGVRFVFTARTHRIAMLDAAPNTTQIALKAFSTAETARHLRQSYPNATDAEVEEFASFSSHNPRVQALAIAQRLPLLEMLRALGPTPTTVERTLSDLLDKAISRLKDEVGSVEGSQVDVLCQCLAVLRPLVPLPVLSHVAQCPASAIRTFVTTLGRPLLVKGDSVHFLDEPSETWFRDTFKPTGPQLEQLLTRMSSLANDNGYAASALPSMLLEAGKLDELVMLALSPHGLPRNNPLERRDIELQRLTFALKACLQARRYADAAKLALRAGGESAAETRQNQLLRENADVASRLLSVSRIEELVSRRTFTSTWLGSNQLYYASLFAGHPELLADARSRLRLAKDWLYAWSRRRSAEDESAGNVTHEDRAIFTLSILVVGGAQDAARFLRGWSPLTLGFDAGKQVARRLFDLSQPLAVDALFRAAENNVWLMLGLAAESEKVGHRLPAEPLKRLLRLLGSRHLRLTLEEYWDGRGGLVDAVSSTVLIAQRVLPPQPAALAAVLKKFLPTRPPYELVQRYGRVNEEMLKAYALYDYLADAKLTLKDLATTTLAEHISVEGSALHHHQEAEQFCRNVGAIWPCYKLWAASICGASPEPFTKSADDALHSLARVESYRTGLHKAVSAAAALVWLETLRDTATAGDRHWQRYREWLDVVRGSMSAQTLTKLCRACAQQSDLHAFALEVASEAFSRIEAMVEEHAEERVRQYIQLARAILPVEKDEASAYFDRAIEIASRIGEENLSRWRALTWLAARAGVRGSPNPQLAYKYSQAAELTYSYSDRHFGWRETVHALCTLCPSSALAITSRWRDRGFGRYERVFAMTIDALVDQQQLPPKTRVAILGIDAQWSQERVLDDALAAAESDPEQQRMLSICYRYVRVLGATQAQWKRFQALGQELGVNLSDIERLMAITPEPDFGSQMAEIPVPLTAEAAEEGSRGTPPSVDWRTILVNVDVVDPEALKQAYHQAQAANGGLRLKDFIAQAVLGSPAGRAGLVKAICRWPGFDMFMLRDLLEAIPSSMRKLVSVRVALKEALLLVCEREPARISMRAVHPFLPWEELKRDRVTDDEEVVESVLRGYVSLIEGADASDLFQLLDSLSAKLSPEQAAHTLEYGLHLLQEALVDDKGDGPWSTTLAPPPEPLRALAGHLWSGLGAPGWSERWAFAHAIRCVAELEWNELLEELAAQATTRDAGPYTDARLKFYEWHARLWFVIGLARAALEVRRLPRACVDLLRAELACEHVLLRKFAAQALLSAGAAENIEDERTLLAINQPALRYSQVDGHSSPVHDEPRVNRSETNKPEFHFGIDIGPYWFAPLGNAFGLSEHSVERRAIAVIQTRMGAHRMTWQDDARYNRGIFNRDRGDTHHSHGSMPSLDNLQAYQSYHAMFMVAADLLRERAVVHRRDCRHDEFSEWLRRYDLSRPNGMWVSDLRDPDFSRLPQRRSYADKLWYWSVTPGHIDSQLLTDEGKWVVWGYWSSNEHGGDEDVGVRSVLTDEIYAPALLAALHTATYRIYLPSSNDSDRFDSRQRLLPLNAWIASRHSDVRIDELDPWGLGVRYPNDAPDDDICQALGLIHSADERTWTAPNKGVLRSESWTVTGDHGKRETAVPGHRLTADGAFVQALLAARPGQCLIISVGVTRNPGDDVAERDQVEPYQWPYSRYYMLTRDGKVRTL
jgi:hypothetical protein